MPDSGLIQRKIYFFKAKVGQNGEQSLNRESLFNSLQGLTDDQSNGRYFEEQDGNALAVWVDASAPEFHLRFVRVRRQDLPSFDRGGTLEQLEIAERDGIAESTHMVFFPGSIVGADYNHHGPRISRFRWYALTKVDWELNLMPLIAPDLLARITRLRDIRVFDIKAKPSFAESIRQANQDLGAAFSAASAALDAEAVQISIRVEKGARENTVSRFLPFIRKILGQSDLRQEVSTLRLEGFDTETSRVEPIDFLKSHLLQRRSIARASERSRSLDPSSAYEQIVAAYMSLRADIESATSLQI